MIRNTTESTLFPYTTLFRSRDGVGEGADGDQVDAGFGHGAEGGGGNAAGGFGEGAAAAEGDGPAEGLQVHVVEEEDRKSTRLNSSHRCISYAVFCLKKKNEQ